MFRASVRNPPGKPFLRSPGLFSCRSLQNAVTRLATSTQCGMTLSKRTDSPLHKVAGMRFDHQPHVAACGELK